MIGKKIITKKSFFVAMILALAGAALAATVPASDSLAYSIYDLVVLQGIGGAPGYVIGATGVGVGLARMGFGASPMVTIGTLIGSGGFLAAPKIVQSLGALF